MRKKKWRNPLVRPKAVYNIFLKKNLSSIAPEYNFSAIMVAIITQH